MGAGGTKLNIQIEKESESSKLLEKLSPHQQERWEESVVRIISNQNKKEN